MGGGFSAVDNCVEEVFDDVEGFRIDLGGVDVIMSGRVLRCELAGEDRDELIQC